MPRPFKLIPEVQTRVINAYAVGLPTSLAAISAGINKRTLFRWFKAAKKADANPELVAFVAACKKARFDAIDHHMKAIFEAAKKNWTASAWWLERQFPEEFSMDRDTIRKLKKFLEEQEKTGASPPPNPKAD